MATFNNVELTAQTMQRTRQHFADNAQACIHEVVTGEVTVNDPQSYFEWRCEQAVDAMAGKIDHTLTFLQRAYYLQTGEMIALLP